MIQLCWMPTWACNFYAPGGRRSVNCPYCVLGYAHQGLVVDGQQMPAVTRVDPMKMVDFIQRNMSAIGDSLTLSGGEPLLNHDLDNVLAHTVPYGLTWGITSNTVLRHRISELAHVLDGLDSCVSWSASYHPAAGREADYEAGVRLVKSLGARGVYANVVLTQSSLDQLDSILGFLGGLPLDRVNALVEMYQPDQVQLAQEKLAQLPHGSLVVGSPVVKGTMCDKSGRFLVVDPQGTVYQCLTKAYSQLDPLGHVADMDLRKMKPDHSWCGLTCPLSCDKVKHLR